MQHKIINSSAILLFFSLLLLQPVATFSQDNNISKEDAKKKKELLKTLKTQVDEEDINITVKSVEITKFPEIKLIIEAYNRMGEPLDSISPSHLTIIENGREFPATSVEKIPVANNLPWDFVFVIDITGSMQPQIDGVIENLNSFTNGLRSRGIDYRLGLILFGDNVEKVYQPTGDVDVFLSWINKVRAFGGGDEKENALEALLASAYRIKYRDEANKVAILITDADYHKKGEHGDGTTAETTQSIIDKLCKQDLRVFSIVPQKIKNYQQISENTRGTTYDIAYPFSNVLENFTRQITNLFLVTYHSNKDVIPDSIEIGLFDQARSTIVKKTIPIVELGRKLIIENLLFKTGKYDLPAFVSELNILAEFMQSKPAITVMIEGHTDSVGSNELNDVLSERRADAVKNYLVNMGVKPNRIQTTGFGKRKPIASNDSEFGRSLNRRTEIVILSK
ncbi:MAG: OmpA family protein [Ignavibacteria bacterium]|jgi:outer membrane protein OmpA-like peptidoglycan-associated protein|nr:OmpA family protein [Ignavibacteria bacterium]